LKGKNAEQCKPSSIEFEYRGRQLRELAEIFADIFASIDRETRNSITLEFDSATK
jgi:hypothetical protein